MTTNDKTITRNYDSNKEKSEIDSDNRVLKIRQRLAAHSGRRTRPCPRVNSCPRGFCCCVKFDSSYQVSKIAEIFSLNQQGALEKQLDPGR